MKNSMVVLAVIVIVVILGIGTVILLSSNTGSTNNTSVTPTPTPQTPTPTPTPTPIPTPTPTPSTGTSSKVDVSIVDMSFPLTTTINKGQTVVWTNNDSLPHTVTFNTISAGSGTLNKGDTFAQQFNDVGTFTYHCKFHSNMIATIVVK